ncbi:MAG: hypothetical protein DME86_12935 [Verrucomicrobia bacterium]|nr:MAG: hypothetical protein DME86_12935 [Verrucomicrobiota bacterium]
MDGFLKNRLAQLSAPTQPEPLSVLALFVYYFNLFINHLPDESINRYIPLEQRYFEDPASVSRTRQVIRLPLRAVGRAHPRFPR